MFLVDSDIQRVVLLATTEETTVAQQVSHIPVKCQSRSWSQICTNVNSGSMVTHSKNKNPAGKVANPMICRGVSVLNLHRDHMS